MQKHVMAKIQNEICDTNFWLKKNDCIHPSYPYFY